MRVRDEELETLSLTRGERCRRGLSEWLSGGHPGHEPSGRWAEGGHGGSRREGKRREGRFEPYLQWRIAERCTVETWRREDGLKGPGEKLLVGRSRRGRSEVESVRRESSTAG